MKQGNLATAKQFLQSGGHSIRGVARALSLSPSFVSDVMLGRRKSQRVFDHVYGLLYPYWDRRGAHNRRGSERRKP